MPPWEVKALFPEYSSQFTRAMKAREIIGGDVKLVGEGALYDFSWAGRWEGKTGEAGGPVKVVDVGGGLGQLLRDLLRDVEGLKGEECVLQDRREVIEEANSESEKEGDQGVLKGVTMMEHDFHQEQPVKGELFKKKKKKKREGEKRLLMT